MDGQDFTYEEAVDEIAKKYGVPRSVYSKMVTKESSNDDSAVSKKGATSRWQIMPATARGLGINPANPLEAAEGGLRILRDNYLAFRQYAENEKHAWMMAVAGYHGSPQNVLKDLKQGGLGLPNISDGAITTRDHVLRIFDGLSSKTLDRIPNPENWGGRRRKNTPSNSVVIPQAYTSDASVDVPQTEVTVGQQSQTTGATPDETAAWEKLYGRIPTSTEEKRAMEQQVVQPNQTPPQAPTTSNVPPLKNMTPNSALSPEEQQDVDLLKQDRSVGPNLFNVDFDRTKPPTAEEGAVEQEYADFINKRQLPRNEDSVKQFNDYRRANAPLVLGDGDKQLRQTPVQAGVPPGKVRVADKTGQTFLAKKTEDGKFAIQNEKTAWVTGDTPPVTELPEEQRTGYDTFRENFQLPDSEELRRKYLSTYKTGLSADDYKLLGTGLRKDQGPVYLEQSKVLDDGSVEGQPKTAANRPPEVTDSNGTKFKLSADQTGDDVGLGRYESNGEIFIRDRNGFFEETSYRREMEYRKAVPQTRQITISEKSSPRDTAIDATMSILADSGIRVQAQDVQNAYDRTGRIKYDGRDYTDIDWPEYVRRTGGKIPFEVTKELTEDILTEKNKRIDMAAELIGRGLGDDQKGEVTANGTKYAEIPPALLKKAQEKGAATSARYKSFLEGYQKSEDENIRSNAPVYAAIAAGIMSPDEGEKLAAQSSQIRQELYAEESKVPVTDGTRSQAVALSGVNPMGWIWGAKTVGAERARTESEIKAAVDRKYAQIIKDYGTASAYLANRNELTREQNDAFAEYQKINGGGYIYPLVLLRKAFNAAPNAVADVMKTASILGEALGVDPWTLSWDDRPAFEREWYKTGAALRKVTESEGLGENITRGFSVFNEAPDVIGQGVFQAALGFMTGGASVPFAFGASQGIAAQYDEAVQNKATRGQRLFSALMGGAAAVPDLFLFNKWFKGAEPVERSGFLSKMAMSLYNKFVGTGVAKEEAEQLTKISLKGFFGKLIVGGLVPEGAQEYSEDKINDAVAALTYDRSPERLRELLNPMSKKNLASFVGGGLGGLFGGAVEVVTDFSTRGSIERQIENIRLGNQEYKTPDEVKEDFVRAVQINQQAATAYEKAELYKENTGLKTEKQQRRYEEAIAVADEYVTEARELEYKATKRAKEILGVKDLTVDDVVEMAGGKEPAPQVRIVDSAAQSVGPIPAAPSPTDIAPTAPTTVETTPVEAPATTETPKRVLTPVPERSVTLAAQEQALNDPKSSSIGVLYPTPDQVPVFNENKFFTVPVENGTLLVSEKKLQKHFAANRLGQYSRNKAVRLIGQGKIAVTDLIGGKDFQTSDTSVAKNPYSLVTTDTEGNELSASVVDPQNPGQSAQNQANLDAERMGENTQSHIVPTQEVVESRQQDRPVDVSKGAPVTRTNRMVVEPKRNGGESVAENEKENPPKTNRMTVEAKQVAKPAENMQSAPESSAPMKPGDKVVARGMTEGTIVKEEGEINGVKVYTIKKDANGEQHTYLATDLAPVTSKTSAGGETHKFSATPVTPTERERVFKKRAGTELGTAIYTTTDQAEAEGYSTGEGALKTNAKQGEGKVVRLSIPKDAKIYSLDETPNPDLYDELAKNKAFRDYWNIDFKDKPKSQDNLYYVARKAGLDIQGILQSQGYVGARHKSFGENTFNYGIWDENILKEGHGAGIDLFRGIRADEAAQNAAPNEQQTSETPVKPANDDAKKPAPAASTKKRDYDRVLTEKAIYDWAMRHGVRIVDAARMISTAIDELYDSVVGDVPPRSVTSGQPKLRYQPEPKRQKGAAPVSRPFEDVGFEVQDIEPEGNATKAKQAISALMPFNIQGNKSDLLSKGLDKIITVAAKASNRVIDAFGGAGVYTLFTQETGAAKQGILNEFDPLRYITHKQIKENPDAVTRAAKAIIADLREMTAIVKEGELFTDFHKQLSLEIIEYFRGKFEQFIVEGQQKKPGDVLEMKDVPDLAGLYLVAQNIAFRFVPIQAEYGSQKGFIVPGLGVVIKDSKSGVGKVALYRESLILKKIDERVKSASKNYENVEVRRGDGWALALNGAQNGDLVTVDTSYLNAGEKKTSNYNKQTEEDAVPEIYTEKIEKFLLPAWDKGVKLLITNNWDTQVVKYLHSKGFKVLRATRVGASQTDQKAGGAAELVAINFDEKSGQIFERSGNGVSRESSAGTGRQTDDGRSINAGEVATEGMDAGSKEQNAAIRRRGNEDRDSAESRPGNLKSAAADRLAPNGKPSNLPADLYDLVRTAEFKKWSADWKNVLKDENGEPLVAYHGSPNHSIEIFDDSRIGENTENEGFFGKGFYFTPSETYANYYTDENGGEEGTGKLYPVFLKFKKPFLMQIDGFGAPTITAERKIRDLMTADERRAYIEERNRTGWNPTGDRYNKGFDPEVMVSLIGEAKFTEILKRGGYDGVIAKHPRGDDELVVFDRSQIKSVENEGAFDENNPSIFKSAALPLGEKMQDIFFSQIERVVDEKMPVRAPADQIKQLVQKAGVKKEELDWMGFNEWLDGRDGELVSKADVLDFIRNNQVQVQEVVKQPTGFEYSPDEQGLIQLIDDAIADPELWDRLDTGRAFDDFADEDERIDYLSFENVEAADNYLRRGVEQATGTELLDATDNNLNAARYEKYTLPGGENYRELLLTLPAGTDRGKWSDFQEWLKERIGAERAATIKLAELNEFKKEWDALNPAANNFKSQHYDEPNVLAHIRFNERTDADGKRVLFIEEIQSDWGQAIRKKGVKSMRSFEEIDRELLNEPEGTERAQQLLDELRSLKEGLPDQPFKKTWHELAFKRMLRYAAENGFDSIAWTTGEMQNERYDLSKQVEQISYRTTDSGDKAVVIVTKEDTQIDFDVNPDGLVTGASESSLQGKAIDEVVGKEIGEKIMSNRFGDLTGVDLKVGGAGMKGFYDKILPTFASKYVKKWGAKVGSTEIATARSRLRVRQDADGFYVNTSPTTSERFNTEQEARDFADQFPQTETVHSIDITPAMTASVMNGQPLFSRRTGEAYDKLTRTLPAAHVEDVLQGMSGGAFQDGNLEINEHDSEMLRRLMAEDYYQRNGRETDEIPFDALTIPAGSLTKLAALGRSMIEDFKAAGYTEHDLGAFTDLLDNLDNLAKSAKDVGVMYVFDEALPEELFHQEDLRSGRTDARAVQEMKQSPFWQQSGDRFNREYPTLVDADKASEIAAKLATDQAAKYGWDKIENFEAEKEKFLRQWAEGILRRNEKRIQSEGIDNFLNRFERIRNYAAIKTSDQRGATETQGDGGAQSSAAKNSEAEQTPAAGSAQTTDDSAETSPGFVEDKRYAAGVSGTERPSVESETLGVTEREVRAKNRKYAATLRENGRDAEDVPYIPESEAGWIQDAQEVLRKSRELADETGQGDYDYALKIFNSPDILPSTKTALGIALIDHLGAAGENAQMLRVAEITTKHVGTAAQALRASQLVSKYDFARGVQLAQKALENRGKVLTDRDVEQIKELTDKYASSERERALFEYALGEAENTIKFLQAEQDELNEALGIKILEVGLKDRTINNLKQQVARWKDKVLGNSQYRARVSQTQRELVDRKAAILERLKDHFGGMGLKSAVVQEDATKLKSAAAAPLDDDTRRALVEYAALQIFDAVPYKELIANLSEITNDTLSADDIKSIHADADLMTRGERVERGGDVLARVKIKNEHRREANAYRDQNHPNLNRLEREALALAKGNEVLGAAAILYARAKDRQEWFDNIDKMAPGLSNKAKDDLFLKARNLRDAARDSLARQRIETQKNLAVTEQEFRQIKERQLLARANAQKHKATLDRYYKYLQRGLADRVLGVLQQIFGIPKGLSATGEISMVGRQNLVLWMTHPLKTANGLQGLGRGLASGVDEIGLLKYMEEIRRHPYFQDAQVHKLEFSHIGDFNIADEHFVATVFDALARAHAENRAADLALVTVRVFGKAYNALELANTLFGDQARLETYAQYARHIDSLALTPQEKKQAKLYAARVVNVFSGRGDIRGVLGSGGALSKLVNLTMFSGRLLVSRPQSLFYLTTGFALAPKGMRAQMAADGLKFYSWLALLAVLAGLRLNPDDKDFGKIKYKGRDLNIDVLAGMDAPLQWQFGIALGTFKQIGAMARGEKSTDAADAFSRLFNKFWFNNDAAVRDDSWLSGLRYWRGKSSPMTSLFFDYYSGHDFIGRDFSWTNALRSRMIPLAYQQTYESLFYDRYASVMKEPSVSTGDLDVLNGLTTFLATGIGFGITQYPNPDQTRAEQVANDLSDASPKSDKKTDEQRRVENGIRTLLKMRAEQAKAGESTARIDQAINKYRAAYKVDQKTFNDLQEQASESKFAYVTQKMSIDEVKKILRVANEQERPELERIIAKKQENLDKRAKLEGRTWQEKTERMTTDRMVEYWKDVSEDLSSDDRKTFRAKLREKAESASRRGTLKPEELDLIRSVFPDLPIQLSPPKPPSPPKKPKGP